MSKTKRVKDLNRPWLGLDYPCWAWCEGHNHAGNIYASWQKFPSAGHLIAATGGADGYSVEWWHPNQETAPAATP